MCKKGGRRNIGQVLCGVLLLIVYQTVDSRYTVASINTLSSKETSLTPISLERLKLKVRR